MSEHQHQAAVIKQYRAKYRKYKDHLIAIPNGSHLAGDAKQRAIQVKKLKREGMKPGVSDLFLALPNEYYCGLWIEMKDQGKTQCSVSMEQKSWLALMESCGYQAEWASGCDEAMNIIGQYMGYVLADPVKPKIKFKGVDIDKIYEVNSEQ